MHGGNVWALAREKSLDPARILDFSADLNPLGPPAQLQAILQDGLKALAHYPDPAYRRFRESAGRAEQTDPSRILPGNGTAELIHLIGRWQAEEAAGVVVPTFTEYQRAARANGSPLQLFLLRENSNFLPDLGALLPKLRQVRLLFLCNPNNPTGTLWPAPLLRVLLEEAGRSGTRVVLDEAYMDFVADPEAGSVVRWVEEFPHLMVLRSLTKILALPGLRVGYLVAAPAVVQELQAIQPPWPLNGLAAWVGAEWLGQEGHRLFGAQTREKVGLFRREFETGLSGLAELRTQPSAVNFFLCRLNQGHVACDLARRLADSGVLIRVCDDFTGLEQGRFIRLAVRTPEENRRFLQLLQELFVHAG